MADRPLSPATRRKPGGPLPRLLPDGPRPHPPPRRLWPRGDASSRRHPVLTRVSPGCPGAGGRLVTCYSPVRHFIPGPKAGFSVRLACVRHAASVHPEPGSNSPFDQGPPWGPWQKLRRKTDWILRNLLGCRVRLADARCALCSDFSPVSGFQGSRAARRRRARKEIIYYRINLVSRTFFNFFEESF